MSSISAGTTSTTTLVHSGDTTGSLVFKTNDTGSGGTEAMRIDTSGNLLVGTTSNYGTSRAIISSANSNTYPSLTVENTASSAPWTIASRITANGGNATNTYHFSGTSNTGDKIYIWGNGNIVNSNNSYGALSDIKLKENIIDATPKLNDVCKLQVRNFNFKSDPDLKQIGFIAQELEQVFPSMVEETKDRNSENETIKTIKTSVLIPILVKAIQELKAINDQQAETINALTARVVALESK